MADKNKKAKSDAKKGERNTTRRNGKAWKVRACGTRHAPDAPCKKCASA